MAIKAIFVGINYSDHAYLEGLPPVYAKSMLTTLTMPSINIFQKDQCRFFTDKDGYNIPGVVVDKPTKHNVKLALEEMVRNAKAGDVLLFYFCGHGANDTANKRGALKTLRSDGSLDVIYSDELEAIFKPLDPSISVTFLIHACFSGAMFSYNPQHMKGIALASVGPDIPTVVRKEADSEDFTTRIRDKVIKKLPIGNPTSASWPTYQQVWDKLKTFTVEGTTKSGERFKGHAEIYHAPQLNPAVKKFLH